MLHPWNLTIPDHYRCAVCTATNKPLWRRVHSHTLACRDHTTTLDISYVNPNTNFAGCILPAIPMIGDPGFFGTKNPDLVWYRFSDIDKTSSLEEIKFKEFWLHLYQLVK